MPKSTRRRRNIFYDDEEELLLSLITADTRPRHLCWMLRDGRFSLLPYAACSLKCVPTRSQKALDFCSLPMIGSCDTLSHDLASCSSSPVWKFRPRDPFCFPDMGVLMSGVLGGSGAAMVVEMGVGGWVMGWGAWDRCGWLGGGVGWLRWVWVVGWWVRWVWVVEGGVIWSVFTVALDLEQF